MRDVAVVRCLEHLVLNVTPIVNKCFRHILWIVCHFHVVYVSTRVIPGSKQNLKTVRCAALAPDVAIFTEKRRRVWGANLLSSNCLLRQQFETLAKDVMMNVVDVHKTSGG